MAVPKNRHTKSRRNSKRSHLKLSATTGTHCEKCGVLKQPHVLCENCGTYKGREVVDVLAKLDKKERKQREKELGEQEEQAGTKREMSMEEMSKQSSGL